MYFYLLACVLLSTCLCTFIYLPVYFYLLACVLLSTCLCTFIYLPVSLRKHAYSNILKILPPKNENFQIKKSDIFYISAQNIDCGYSLEPPHRGGSNKNRQFYVLNRNKKNNIYPCKPQFYYIKVGFKGVKLIEACFCVLFSTCLCTFIYLFIKVCVVGTHLNCFNKSRQPIWIASISEAFQRPQKCTHNIWKALRQFKQVPTTYFYKEYQKK